MSVTKTKLSNHPAKLDCPSIFKLRRIAKLFAVGVVGVFSHIAEAVITEPCSAPIGKEPHAEVIGTVNFGSTLRIKKSDPVGTVLATASVDAYENFQCFRSGVYNPSYSSYETINGSLGSGQPASGTDACQTGIPGIGIRFTKTPKAIGGYGIQSRCQASDYFSMTPQKSIEFVISPGEGELQLIKTGDIAETEVTLSTNLYRYGIRNSSGSVYFQIDAKPVVISSLTPTCTLSASGNRTVDLGKADSNTLNNGSAPYISFQLPFSCESGANLNAMQLMIDGKGVSSNTPGLITPDNTNEAGAAQNVMIELVDGNQQRLSFKQNFSLPLPSSDTNIPFKARLYAESSKPAGPGKITANLTFTLTQK